MNRKTPLTIAVISTLVLLVGTISVSARRVQPRLPQPPEQEQETDTRPAPAGDMQVASPQASTVETGEPGLSFRYVETFGVTEKAYPASTDYLNGPNGLFIDGNDDLYLAEELGARILKYRLSDGTNLLSIGTAGFQNRGELTFDEPLDVAVDSNDNIWTVDSHRVAQYDANGNFLQEFPEDDPWNSGDDNSHFDEPRGLAFDDDGRLYVADHHNHRVQVYSVTVDSSLVYSTTIGETGVSKTDNSHFNGPAQLAFDDSGRLYVTDVWNYRVQRCTYASGWTCEMFHGDAGNSGSGSDQLNLAFGLHIDGNDIYIADAFNGRVKRCNTSNICSEFASGIEWPADVAVDSSGSVYVSDFYDHTIRKYDSSGTEADRFKGNRDEPYNPEKGYFNAPYGVAVDDTSGDIFLTEYAGYRLVKLDADGNQQWALGEAGVYGSDNEHFGGLRDGPAAVAVDSNGAAYVADTDNYRVQKCTASGCTTFAGIPGDTGSDPKYLEDPFGVAVDADDNIYIAEQDNHRIQKCTPAGECEIIIGTTDVTGEEYLNTPMGLALDSSNNVYVADTGSNRVLKCEPGQSSYSCETFAGTYGASGADFGYFNRPHDVAVDDQGRVYVADIYNDRVQVFDSTGAYLTTISGDWGGKVGEIRQAIGVAVDAQGNVYISDHVNHRIQKFAPGVPGWRQVNINGFGNTDNWSAWSLGTFNDALYASTGNFSSGTEVYRLSSDTWEQVVSGGFGDSDNVAVNWFAEFNNSLYVGTWSSSGGGEIWRSSTGDSGSWFKVVDNGFGDANNNEIMTLASFDGYLYAGTFCWDTSAHGAQIWRSSSGETGSWTQKVGDAEFGDSDNSAILSFEVFDGALYAATHNDSNGGEVWYTTDGTTWNPANANGFGDGRNRRVVSLEVFDGTLYAGTWNSTTGAEIWRTANGTTWNQVASGGFDGTDNEDIASLVAFDGDLYAVVGNFETGPEVWRSPTGDKESWQKVTDTGFGGGAAAAVDWDIVTAVFEDSLYVGTFTYGNGGGRVWQMLRQVYLPLVLRIR